MHIIEAIGRIFISILFLIEGIRKLFYQEETIIYMEDHGVPELLFFPSVALEIFFPLLLIIGYKTKISSSVMALFTLSVALIFHTEFENEMELIFFLKDIAIAGGFLIIAANEPKICSIDFFLKKNNEKNLQKKNN